jgi:hypothetical protein
MASLNEFVCSLFKYIVYTIKAKDNIFINKDVLKKLLNGLIMKSTIIKIEVAEHIHTFFVESVNIIKLNGVSESI